MSWYTILMLIVGLGNHGKEYETTRHNTGRIILSHIAKMHNFSAWKDDSKLKGNYSKGEIENEKMEFLEPNTFMNNSGVSVAQIINTPKKLKNLVVVYDDMDLPIGTLKISYDRSSGGHNGVESIIKKLKSREFLRIRVGVSPATPSGKIRKPKGEDKILKFLMGKFKEDELKILKKQSKQISEILKIISSEGKDKAMSLYN